MRAKIISLLVLLILFTIFVAQNTEQTIMNVFFWTIEMPKIVLLIITLVIGVILGLIAVTVFSRSDKKKIKEKAESFSEKTEIRGNSEIN
jgi:uncharacterized integral membrane protein